MRVGFQPVIFITKGARRMPDSFFPGWLFWAGEQLWRESDPEV